jgi:8-oxo-dGTP pyrophosphatase MutT (NUDIX family)
VKDAEPQALRRRIRDLLAGSAPGDPAQDACLAGLPPQYQTSRRHIFTVKPAAASVLVPLVDRPEGLTVLLTVRSAGLKHHAGQISLPGGRLEATDTGAVAAALRETEEEIGLQRRFVEVIGYLPDHLVISGYRVTPVVGFVTPGFELTLDAREVVGAFEVPLTHVLNPANHGLRERSAGTETFQVYDIPYGEHRIWGATAGILMTLHHMLEPQPQ